MEFSVKISKRGSFTIPAAVRKALGLKAGQRVQLWMEGNMLMLDFGVVADGSKRFERKPRKQ